MVNKFRKLLIRFGKILPFFLCFIVLISYIESFVALYCQDYMSYEDYTILTTPLSFWIAQKFEYDMLTIFVATILSIALETCTWNKLACLYLGIGLTEKSYFDFELDIETIYCICIINIIASTYLTYKGIKIITK